MLNCRLAELQYCLTTSTEDVLVWDPDVVIFMMVGSTVPGYVLLIFTHKILNAFGHCMKLDTATWYLLVVDSFMVNDGQVCIFLLPRVASKVGWTLVTYPGNCNLPSLNQTLPILVWLYIRGSRGCVYRKMHALTGAPAMSMFRLSTAKLVRWVLLHCTIVLFPSLVSWTVVTPSVDQPPLPILLKKRK